MILHDAFYKSLPFEQKRYDYGVRTDGQPVYCGFARLGTLLTDESWILVYTKYNVDDSVAEQYCLKGAWNERVSLFIPYV